MVDPNRFNHDPIADSYDVKVRRAQSSPGPINYLRENYSALQARVLEWADLQPGCCALDIGIGTGLMWEDHPVRVELVGVDVSARMLAKVAAKGLARELKQAHFMELPFADQTFDRVVSTYAFHHVEHGDKPRAITEMARVLKSSGVVVLGDLMFRDPVQKQEVLERMWGEQRQDIVGGIAQEFYTDISAVRPHLESLGFHVSFERASTLSWILRAQRCSGSP